MTDCYPACIAPSNHTPWQAVADIALTSVCYLPKHCSPSIDSVVMAALVLLHASMRLLTCGRIRCTQQLQAFTRAPQSVLVMLLLFEATELKAEIAAPHLAFFPVSS